MNPFVIDPALRERLITRFASETTLDPSDLRGLAVEENFIPLLLDMGGFYALSEEGEVFSCTWDEPRNRRIETDERILNLCLFQGTQRFSELFFLIPARPDDAEECSTCGGTGIEPMSAAAGIPNVVCYCGGLGWLPAGSVDPFAN